MVEPPTNDDHLAPDELLAFAQGALESEPAYRVSDHLAVCTRCRAVFAEAILHVEPVDSPSGRIPLLTPLDDAPPKIAGYEQLQRVAQGGMGTIYRALQSDSRRQVAIKCIAARPWDSYCSDRRQRLVREAEALTKLDHPQIVRALQLVLVADAPALVMEYVAGTTLQRWLRSSPPAPETAAKLMLQLAEAIGHAHSRGVIHCDLKPQNVLVTTADPVPQLKVVDFGLAKLSDGSWDITHSGDVLGSPAYMAPEQTTGNVIAAQPTIDIYGLGTILYELLLGTAPFAANEASVLLTKVANERPSRPHHARPEIPLALDLICMKCLEKSPGDRYESAQQVADDLRAFLEGRPILAREPSGPRRPVQQVFSVQEYAGLMVIVVILMLLAGVGFWWEWRTNQRLLSSLQQVVQAREQAEHKVEEARANALEELRASLEETSERLFGSTLSQDDSEWKSLARIGQRWRDFAEQLDDSEESQLISAEATMRLGSIDRIAADLDQAEKKLKAALELLAALSKPRSPNPWQLALDAETRQQLARCYFERGQAADALQTFDAAIANVKRSLEVQPDNARIEVLSARIQRDYGTVLTRSGRLVEAQSQLDSSIKLLERLVADGQTAASQMGDKSRSSVAPFQILRGQVLMELCSSRQAYAMLLRLSGHAREAIEVLNGCSADLKTIRLQLADDSRVTRLLGAHQFMLGYCHFDLGEWEASRGCFLLALEYQKQLLQLYPRRQDVRKNYGSYCGLLGLVHVRLNQGLEALDYFSKAVQVMSELAEEKPDHPEYLHEKALTMTNIVATLAAGNRLAEAVDYADQLIAIRDTLQRSYPQQVEYEYGLAASLNIVGEINSRQGQSVKAHELLGRAKESYARLITRFPDVPIYRIGIANADYLIAEQASREQQWERAIQSYSKVIETLDGLPSPSQFAEALLRTKTCLGQALAYQSQGDRAASVEQARRGCEVIEPWRGQDVSSGELYRRCLELAGSEQCP